jgi:hypothetical protein
VKFLFFVFGVDWYYRRNIWKFTHVCYDCLEGTKAINAEQTCPCIIIHFENLKAQIQGTWSKQNNKLENRKYMKQANEEYDSDRIYGVLKC